MTHSPNNSNIREEFEKKFDTDEKMDTFGNRDKELQIALWGAKWMANQIASRASKRIYNCLTSDEIRQLSRSLDE